MTAVFNLANDPFRDPPRKAIGPADALLRTLSPDAFDSGSAHCIDLAGLAAVQSSMMRHYFRLLRAEAQLERRAQPAHATPSSVIGQLEAERARLGHELHAGAGQALAGIKIHLELIDAALADPPEVVRASLHRIGLLAQEALQQLRVTAHRIHPPDWQRMTLAEALETLWDTCGIARKFEAALELAPLPAEPDHYARVLLYRTAQEALTNVIRHAGATRIKMSLAPRSGSVALSIEDNGSGFDVHAVLNRPGRASAGIGLRAMRDQLRDAGGEMYLESGPGGTRLTVCVPAAEPR